MKKARARRAVTAVICCFILIFAGLIAYPYLKRPGAVSGMPGNGGAASGAGGQPSGQASPGGSVAGGQAPPAGTALSGGDNFQGASGGPLRNATAVRVTEVVRGTIENSVVINGDVLARTQVSIYPTVAGKLTEARLSVGDTVRQGDIVAMVDPSRPGEVYSQSPVVSTIGGTILQAPVNPGDTLSVQTPVYVVGDLSSLVLETFVPERFSTSVRRGLSAQVRLEALPGEIFSAVVDEVSPVLDPASRTLRIRLRFSGPRDNRIKAGMFATLSLVTNSRRNVPVIPREAVINTYGAWIIFIVNDQNLAVRREIKLGLENEDFLEVVEGLEPGERVVSAGQNFLSDGDPVRIVE